MHMCFVTLVFLQDQNQSMQIANIRLDRTRTHAIRIAYLENMDIIMNPLFVDVTRLELVKYVAVKLLTNR